MLGEIYNWFTESFDTRDLKEPKPYSTSSAASPVRLRISPNRNIGRRSHP